MPLVDVDVEVAGDAATQETVAPEGRSTCRNATQRAGGDVDAARCVVLAEDDVQELDVVPLPVQVDAVEDHLREGNR